MGGGMGGLGGGEGVGGGGGGGAGGSGLGGSGGGGLGLGGTGGGGPGLGGSQLEGGGGHASASHGLSNENGVSWESGTPSLLSLSMEAANASKKAAEPGVGLAKVPIEPPAEKAATYGR